MSIRLTSIRLMAFRLCLLHSLLIAFQLLRLKVSQFLLPKAFSDYSYSKSFQTLFTQSLFRLLLLKVLPGLFLVFFSFLTIQLAWFGSGSITSCSSDCTKYNIKQSLLCQQLFLNFELYIVLFSSNIKSIKPDFGNVFLISLF